MWQRNDPEQSGWCRKTFTTAKGSATCKSPIRSRERHTSGVTLIPVKGTLYITGDANADGLLNGDGFALLVGMLLDQQVPMEWAFRGRRR